MCSTDNFIECGLCRQVNKGANSHIFEKFYPCYQFIVLIENWVFYIKNCRVYDGHLFEFFQVIKSVFSEGIVRQTFKDSFKILLLLDELQNYFLVGSWEYVFYSLKKLYHVLIILVFTFFRVYVKGLIDLIEIV